MKEENLNEEEKTKKKQLKKIETIEENNSKNNSFSISLLIIIILLVAVIIGLTMWATKEGKFDFIFNKIESKEKIKLKHTSKATVKSEGVYITDVSEIVDNVMPSIVAITSKTVIDSGQFGFSFFGNRNYVTEGAGSGVIVAENTSDIFIVTNYHVVENSSQLAVTFIDEKNYDASIKGVSKRKDIAIVSVSKKNIDKETLKKIQIATLGNSDELKVGNGIIAIGNALGYGQSVTTGVVSALNREVSTDESIQDMIQIDAAINGGNSGGALLNSKGEVIGINTAKFSSNSSSSSASIEGMGFAIPISDVESVIKNLINGKDDNEGLSLGIEGYMTNEGAIANYNLPSGFYISGIQAGSNASKSELEIGNIITEIEGNKVTSVNTIRKVLNKKEKGETIKIKIKYASKNEYKEKEITITLS